jgi:short-subunit dehydrogenase involved in D-alanine esterification of teichoic acids
MRLVDKPININISNQIASPKLEDKLLELLDKIITDIKSEPVKNQIQEIKQDIQQAATDISAKQRITAFFKEIGDSNSNTHKAIKGAGIAKNIISEILKLGNKLKDLL